MGGPSYLGAMLAHYLDALIGFYAACFLLGRVCCPPRTDKAPAKIKIGLSNGPWLLPGW